MTWAQGMERGQRSPHHRQFPLAEAVTVSGYLTVAYGMPAIRSSETTYIVGRLCRLIGFVDGLREGAQVTIEGSAIASRRSDAIMLLNPIQLTLDGRTFDMASPGRAFGMNRHSRGEARQRGAFRYHHRL